MPPSGISVIICTFNGSNRIELSLKSLVLQSINTKIDWEILVIDNGSTDNTISVVQDCWNNFNSRIPLRIISEPKQGKANALIKGYAEAKYELMLLCDDDNWLQPEYITTVIEIFQIHPEITLAGGYGIAEFRNENRPIWFDKWQNNYACGKHHQRSGFLDTGDFRIWGAGSILRKSFWNHLIENGFQYVNSTQAGKPLGEDTEISLAVIYAGGKLYFDERLWFYHDLSGGRVTWENFLNQMKINGKISAGLVIFNIAYIVNSESKFRYYILLCKRLIRHFSGFIFQLFIRNNKAMVITRFEFIKELALNSEKNYLLFLKSYKWISRIKAHGIKYIILKPIGGLCNRLRSISSAIQLSKDLQKPLIIYWTKARGLNCHFRDLFKPIDEINIIETNNLSILLKHGVYRGLSIPSLTKTLYKCDYKNNNDIVKSINLKSDFKKLLTHRTFFAETCEYFYPSTDTFRLFQPIDSIQDKITSATSQFDSFTIGVHIRRTDNKLSIEKSPLELFEKTMKAELENEPRTNFYVASDWLETKKQLISIFTGKVSTNLETTSRLTTEGMQNAVIDLYCLSKTSKILSSYWSSFSWVASKLTGINEITISK